MTPLEQTGTSPGVADSVPLELRDDPAFHDRGLVLEDVLGVGGHSIVYRARDERHGRDVAVKVLRHEARLESAAARFAQEVQVAAGLRHPHILPLYDSGTLRDGRPFSVMPVAHGQPLRALIDGANIRVAEAVHLTREVGEALAFLHERGWVHRDVKPENILVEAGHAVLTDFGIAAPMQSITARSSPDQVATLWSGHRFTSVGSVVGTLPYVSPEILFGDAPVDARGDVYALGIVLYEMLTGSLPFHGLSAAELVGERLQHPLPPAGETRNDVPPELDAVIARATISDPAERFASVTEFIEALDAVPIGSRTTPIAWRLGAVTALLFAALAGTIGVWRARAAIVLDPNRVVVADLANDTGDSALAPIGSLAGDIITGALARQQGLEVINATESLGSRQRPRLPAADSSLARQTRALVENSRAGLVVTGAYYRDGHRLALLAELTDTRGGEVIGAFGPIAASEGAPEQALKQLADSISAAVQRRGGHTGAPPARSS